MKIIGELKSSSQPGEKKVYRLLEALFGLDKDTFCYFQPEIGDKRPDFLLITPKYGSIIIEVKDYSPNSIIKPDITGKWKLSINDEDILASNPFDQILSYWEILRKRVDSKILSQRNQIPLHQLIIFSNITRKGLVGQKILTLQGKRQNIFFKEDLTNFQVFQRSLVDLYSLDPPLSSKEISYLRSRFVWTSIIPHIKHPKIYDFENVYPPEEILKVFDRDQEQFAYGLGDGHRLIFGVAGSGKTILLLARSDYLARIHTNWNILILCYNKLLAAYLYKLIKPQTYEARIEIKNFHKWAKELITGSTIEFSTKYQQKWNLVKNKQSSKDEFFEIFVPKLLTKVISEVNLEKYDAILIDEAQDFDKNWFIPVVQLLNPQTNSLLITCDGLQGIYARKRFHWSDVGIDARGRVKKFHRTYRNPEAIGKLAYQFLLRDPDFEQLIKTEEEFLETTKFVRKGGQVDLTLFNNREEEYSTVAKNIRDAFIKKQSVLVLFPWNLKKTESDHILITELKNFNLECQNLSDFGSDELGIYIGTLQGTKGLETDVVIIPDIDLLYNKSTNRQLLYVGMTRALHHLILTSIKKTGFMKEIRDILNSGDSNIITEMLHGKRCYYCKMKKDIKKEKPLCYSCWKKLLNYEICYLCGSSLSIQVTNTSTPIFIACDSCMNELITECKVCQTPIKRKKGKSLCYRCYKTLRNAYSSIEDYIYSQDF